MSKSKSRLKRFLAPSVSLGLCYLAYREIERRSHIDLRGKVVLITGGSRGLGLQLGREFGLRGAVIAICARDEEELKRAQQDLRMRGIDAHTRVCDVSERDQVESSVRHFIERLGRIDVLVNNAGIIQVGPVSNFDIGDFERAMDTMFWGSLYTTLAVLPAMKKRGRGNIVNITSIGGKISVPHLLPYSCAKFALVALSEGLRSELSPFGIRVTTVVPGLMRTGGHLQAEFKGRQSAEYAWFAAGAATPLLSISATRAARSVVRATIRGDAEKILSLPADIAARLHSAMPSVTGKLLSAVNRLLPTAISEKGDSRKGSDLEAEFHSTWKIVTEPGRQAGEALNQL